MIQILKYNWESSRTGLYKSKSHNAGKSYFWIYINSHGMDGENILISSVLQASTKETAELLSNEI